VPATARLTLALRTGDQIQQVAMLACRGVGPLPGGAAARVRPVQPHEQAEPKCLHPIGRVAVCDLGQDRRLFLGEWQRKEHVLGIDALAQRAVQRGGARRLGLERVAAAVGGRDPGVRPRHAPGRLDDGVDAGIDGDHARAIQRQLMQPGRLARAASPAMLPPCGRSRSRCGRRRRDRRR
jgi:hypothetical protein